MFVAAELANCARRRNVKSENLVNFSFFSETKKISGKLRPRFLNVELYRSVPKPNGKQSLQEKFTNDAYLHNRLTLSLCCHQNKASKNMQSRSRINGVT